MPEALEDDLAIVADSRIPGTCEWFSTQARFLGWRDFAPAAPSILWVNGKPAAGKSILAGYAIEQLQKQDADCSYFFFKYRDKSKSRLGACLRSLAFQMACSNPRVRDTLLEMQNDEINFDSDNERTIWRQMFLSRIFQSELPQHYWVIDALDECENIASFFDQMLSKLDRSLPLRILVTSRETSTLEKHFFALGSQRFQAEKISAADTLPDIRLLVEARANLLPVKGIEERAALADKILIKSQGSFLWTVLVLNELSHSYGKEEINQVLDDVPRDMELLYQRTVDLMSQATRGKMLAKSILLWTACTTKPLTVSELEGALKIDTNDSFPRLEDSIAALCGQLVMVDKFGKVEMVHETAREFLFNDSLDSEFAINRVLAHTRIARACLVYLTGEEMRPPRSNRCGSARSALGKRAGFSLYACTSFSYHLAMADPLANDLLILLAKFLNSNVLAWMEVTARTGNLTPLIRAARDLRTFFKSSAAERPPLGGEMRTIGGWTTDLVRIAAKFGDALIVSPSAIYSLLLPFCPTESAAYKSGKSGWKLKVVGFASSQWDDRLSCIEFKQAQTSVVCHGDEFFAVGLTTGTVALYHATTCQEYKVLHHGEAIRLLQFKGKTDILASCGTKTIRIWDIRTGDTVYNFLASPRTICLAFDDDLLITASYKNYLASWDLLKNGMQKPNRPWNDSTDQTRTTSRRPPCAISISVSHRMMAVAYSGRPVMLWDLEQDTYYGSCGKKLPNGETSTHMVTALVLNPNPSIDLLAASYLDGELVIIDPFDDRDLESLRAHCHTLTVSPDGRLLAGGAGSGSVQVYEFETLRLIYRVKSTDLYIKQLSFSKDGLQLIDIRGSQCNVWRPAAFLPDSDSDDSSGCTSTSTELVASDTKDKICAITMTPKGDHIFCGKMDGVVSLYDLKTATEVRTLYSHRSLIRSLTWWPQSNIMMSIDTANNIFAWTFKGSQSDGWMIENSLFQSRLDCGQAILDLLPGEAVGKFVLSTRDSDYLWTINGQQADMRTNAGKQGIRKWIQHPQSPPQMICIEGAAARVYAWSDWSEILFISLCIDVPNLQLKSVKSYMKGHQRRFLLELSELNGSATTRDIHTLDGTSFSIENDLAGGSASTSPGAGHDDSSFSTSDEGAVAVVPTLCLTSHVSGIAHHVAHVINVTDSGKLTFLDTHSWVSSADLESLGNGSISYSRHFFVPYDWFSGTRSVICAIAQRDVVFARNDGIAIVKGGFDYTERVTIGGEDAGLKEAEVRLLNNQVLGM